MTWIIFISFHSFCFLLSLSKEFSSDLSLSVCLSVSLSPSLKNTENEVYIYKKLRHTKNEKMENQNSDRSSCFRLWSSKSPNKPCSAKSNPDPKC